MQVTTLRPAQEVVLSVSAESQPAPHPGFCISREVKCFHCGFVSGEFITEPDQARLRSFLRVSNQCPSEVVILGSRMRCCRCGGPVYLDEVETLVRLRPEDLEKPKRGRKPKRPA